jgi:hypothetical protein
MGGTVMVYLLKSTNCLDTVVLILYRPSAAVEENALLSYYDNSGANDIILNIEL